MNYCLRISLGPLLYFQFIVLWIPFTHDMEHFLYHRIIQYIISVIIWRIYHINFTKLRKHLNSRYLPDTSIVIQEATTSSLKGLVAPWFFHLLFTTFCKSSSMVFFIFPGSPLLSSSDLDGSDSCMVFWSFQNFACRAEMFFKLRLIWSLDNDWWGKSFHALKVYGRYGQNWY